MPLSTALSFKSERFDYQSELPAECNAGNRFYGKDVAEFIATSLTGQGFPAGFLDEDWGWLVFSAKGASPEFLVAVYNLAEHGEGGRPGVGAWGLWVRAYEKRKLLGVLTKRTEMKVPEALLAAIRAAVAAAGAKVEAWDQGPE